MSKHQQKFYFIEGSNRCKFYQKIRLIDQQQALLIEQIENLNYAENIENHQVLRNKNRWQHFIHTAKELQSKLNNLAFYRENDLISHQHQLVLIASINEIIQQLNDNELKDFKQITWQKDNIGANELNHLRELLIDLDKLKKQQKFHYHPIIS